MKIRILSLLAIIGLLWPALAHAQDEDMVPIYEAVPPPEARGPAPKAVDMGLSVKWASFNIDAAKPGEYGNFFAWGEEGSKMDYSWSTYRYCPDGEGYSLTKYNTDDTYGPVDNKTALALSDDVAHLRLGGKWRMPTIAEWDELRLNCEWVWTTQNGNKGYQVISHKNGKRIFLPAGDICRNTERNINAGSYGFYWSSTLDINSPTSAWALFFGSTFIEQDGGCLRCHGRSVRPVYDESLQEDDEVDIYPFYVVTEKPTFNGGDSNNFAKWIALHLTYPEEAKKKGLTGRVWLSFDIDKDGTLTNVRVLRSVHKILDDEAIRVVSSSPKWEPGTMYGKPIKVTFSMPVIFELR